LSDKTSIEAHHSSMNIVQQKM